MEERRKKWGGFWGKKGREEKIFSVFSFFGEKIHGKRGEYSHKNQVAKSGGKPYFVGVFGGF